MATHEIDLEKQPMITTTSVESPTAYHNTPQTPLDVYQILVGDISAKPSIHNDDLYHNVVHEQRRVSFWYLVSAFGFGACIAMQIILCLGIAAGAQLGLTMDQITILASVNTGVATVIAGLKGLGLPEKKAVERRRLQKLAEKIRFTTRKLKAGLKVDAVAEAEDVRKTIDEAEDDAEIVQKLAAMAAPPAVSGDKKE